jgi:hypothetical protein
MSSQKIHFGASRRWSDWLRSSNLRNLRYTNGTGTEGKYKTSF